MKNEHLIPFLKQVAEIYAESEPDKLIDYCFVFPNKRSATFFNSFLRESLPSATIAPETLTISDFVSSLSPLVEANRFEQLFTLFNEYRKLHDENIEFDRFLFWGEMLLNDFNDVDRYLVNPEALFVNVKRLKEISTDYLSDEQRNVIARFWGEQAPQKHVSHFWNHLDYGDEHGSQSKFIKLWEVLLPLYNAFNAHLAKRGLISNGMLYRNAAEILSKHPATDVLPYDRYIFVGFNVLSTAEIAIFSHLQKRGLADFYWDFNSPALRIPDNRARRFITRNMSEFPSRYPLKEAMAETMPTIRIIGVPSAVGQVKSAAMQISQWIDDNVISDTSNATDTAIVLPDESLFIPMIHSMPPAITTLNVTMGFPMKLSPIASLMKQIVSLQLRSRKSHGKPTFFYQDVKPLLAAPVIASAAPLECETLSEYIVSNRLFQIPADEIINKAPSLIPIFEPIGNSAAISEVQCYINRLCDFLTAHTNSTERIGRHFIESYREACRNLCNAAADYGIDIQGHALFHMIERTINSGSVNFIGEPLAGLQLMGVLETRALDFRNIIMLSMNEKVFPRKLYTRSFIPDALRRGYGMSTLDFQESIFAYYFYRLLSRAENVTLIYDARRVGGNRSNEISRYLAQLLYIFGNETISHELGVYHTQPFDTQEVSVRKDERIQALLREFTPDGGNRCLSASAINTYINCPLEFYLRYVERFNSEDEITDYVDFSTFGTILHEVMEKFYRSFQHTGADGSLRPVEITPEMLDRTINDRHNIELDRLITKTINRCFNNYKEDKILTPLAGETLVLSRIFKQTVIEMLKIDRSLTPFTFVAAEYQMVGRLNISPELTVNVRQIIDRIDISDGIMRFVDYKTGDDNIDTSSISELFNGMNPNRAKAVMQLLTYCHIYRQINNDNRPITPVIYKMRTIMTHGIRISEIGTRGARKGLYDYRDFYDEFTEAFNHTVNEIFNPEIDFTQNKSDHNCKFCMFKSICSQDNK